MKQIIGIVCALTIGLIVPVRVARADDTATQIQSVVSKVAPAIVTIKAVMKTEFSANGQSRDVESRVTMLGVVVDKDGLIMISNAAFSPGRVMALMGQGDGSSKDLKAVPIDFKVIFEQEDKEYSGFLAATDSKLDLAFIKIEDLGDRKLSTIDFSTGADPVIGQEILTVARLEKGYDYAPYFATARIGGVIERPRKAFLLSGIGNFGLPMYTLAGENIGVVTTVESGVQSEGSVTDVGTMLRFASGGGLLRAFIVPTSVVNALIAQARLRAVTVAAERAKKKAAADEQAKKAAADKSKSGAKKP